MCIIDFRSDRQARVHQDAGLDRLRQRTESGQAILIRYRGETGGYVPAMYLYDGSPVAAYREIWAFPKKLASPT
jgi:acetoacetate decarboxylase